MKDTLYLSVDEDNVNSDIRYDAYFVYPNTQDLTSLGMKLVRKGDTLEDFVIRVVDNLRRRASDIGRLPSVFQDPPGARDAVFDAMLQTRGNGIAVFLLTRKFWQKRDCIAALLAFFNIMRRGRSGETVKVCFVTLDDFQRPFPPEVEDLARRERVHRISTDTVPMMANEVAELIWLRWNNPSNPNVLGCSAEASLRDLVTMAFTNDDLSTAKSVFRETNCSDFPALYESARRSKKIGFHNIEKLKDVARLCNGNGANPVRLIEAYERKFVRSLAWEWDASERDMLKEQLDAAASNADPSTPPAPTQMSFREQHLSPGLPHEVRVPLLASNPSEYFMMTQTVYGRWVRPTLTVGTERLVLRAEASGMVRIECTQTGSLISCARDGVRFYLCANVKGQVVASHRSKATRFEICREEPGLNDFALSCSQGFWFGQDHVDLRRTEKTVWKVIGPVTETVFDLNPDENNLSALIRSLKGANPPVKVVASVERGSVCIKWIDCSHLFSLLQSGTFRRRLFFTGDTNISQLVLLFRSFLGWIVLVGASDDVFEFMVSKEVVQTFDDFSSSSKYFNPYHQAVTPSCSPFSPEDSRL